MKKFVQNPGRSPMYVGGVMVPPGEGAMVTVPDEPDNVDGAVRLEDLPPTLALSEQIAGLLTAPVAELLPTVGALNDDALGMMLALESGAKKPRSTLVTALGQEQIRRANEALDAVQAGGDTEKTDGGDNAGHKAEGV